MPKPVRSKRVSKAQWLNRALEVLAAEGVGGVRIERLARDLGVAKSGFYWHFADRPDLLTQMLDYWSGEFTDSVIQEPALQHGEPTARLSAIVRLIHEQRLDRYEIAMRAWAEQDPAVWKIVRQVYDRRNAFLRDTFTELGFSGDDLEIRVRLFVCYQSWGRAMFGDASGPRSARLTKAQLALLTRK